MTWPRKGTRKTVVDGESYLWNYKGHCLWCSDDVFTVGRSDSAFVLYIDPYPFGAEVRPANVADAIRWAVNHGWDPDSGPTKSMALNQGQDRFEWLPDGVRHIGCARPVPEDI